MVTTARAGWTVNEYDTLSLNKEKKKITQNEKNQSRIKGKGHTHDDDFEQPGSCVPPAGFEVSLWESICGSLFPRSGVGKPRKVFSVPLVAVNVAVTRVAVAIIQGRNKGVRRTYDDQQSLCGPTMEVLSWVTTKP